MRFASKLAQHVPDMVRYRRAARDADVVHFQWLTVQPLDVRLLPTDRPVVLTAHDVIPREPRPGQIKAQKRLYERVDAIVVHSHAGPRAARRATSTSTRRRCTSSRTARSPTTPSSRRSGRCRVELAAVEKPVVLFFGLIRPYKGLDTLLNAWRGIGDAELWVVGMPRMPLGDLRAAAPPNVRWMNRFVDDAEIPALFRRADLVVLPYRQIDQSGVLFTALAFGKPLLLSAVGGFPEVADLGAAELVTPGDRAALHIALRRLLDDPARRERLAAGARAAAAGPYDWDTIAADHLALYRALT